MSIIPLVWSYANELKNKVYFIMDPPSSTFCLADLENKTPSKISFLGAVPLPRIFTGFNSRNFGRSFFCKSEFLFTFSPALKYLLITSSLITKAEA